MKTDLRLRARAHSQIFQGFLLFAHEVNGRAVSGFNTVMEVHLRTHMASVCAACHNQVAKLHKNSDMRKSTFRFKRFDCTHGGGSMKIGVDAVLVGAWADVSGARHIIDVGTGCGVIALMCAQRAPEAMITAIDIDEASVAEASGNFAASPWRSGFRHYMPILPKCR